MKKLSKNLTMYVVYICMFIAVFCAMTLKAEAANVISGTLGDNGGITYTYDADTKTLTITGEDSGLQGDYNRTEYTYKSQFATICADVEVIKVQNCTLKGDATGVFAGLNSLKTIECNNFDTSNVTDMKYMFYNCKNLSGLDVSNFDTSNVIDMRYMFYNCRSLSSLDASNFDTSRVENMSFMFQGCRSLSSLDVGNFDTANVRYMIRMFYNCSSLSSVDLSAFDLTKVECADGMYYVAEMLSNCSNLALIETPKKMPTGMTITLPDTFYDAKGTEYTSIDNTICGKTLYSRQMYNMVASFVERMYTVALGRASESTGINYWTEELLSHRKDGAAISAGFIMSKEFKEKNYSNEEYLKVLYRTFFDREADANGMSFWLEQMKAGRSRKSVLAGFVNSKEFTEICESFGITRGNMEDDATATGAGQFVERLYTIAMERPSDPAGLEDWAQRINNKTNTPEQVAKEFFLSPEYTGKNTSNDKYVETLYLVFMDRASEAGGKAYWVEQLNNGVSRESVLEGFAQSEEFKEIMARYGL